MQVYSKKFILDFIAKLLHPKFTIDVAHVSFNQNFYDKLVQLSSGHYVLPAIYGALKYNNLCSKLDKDLIKYLKQISEINYERNKMILKQIKFLDEVFKKNNIEHVFLKGAAILLSMPYNAINERMVGDIDILVNEKDILRAQSILIKQGFTEVSSDIQFTSNVFSKKKKHLDRLVKNEFIAAVELHRFLFRHNKSKELKPTEVLKNKVKTSDGFCIPSKTNMWKHAILNWQYNDEGLKYNYLSFKTLMDVFYLEPENIKSDNKLINKFYDLISLHIKEYNKGYSIKKLHYSLQLHSKKFHILNRFIVLSISFLHLLINRFFLLIKSAKYRSTLLKNPILLRKKLMDYWGMYNS